MQFTKEFSFSLFVAHVVAERHTSTPPEQYSRRTERKLRNQSPSVQYIFKFLKSRNILHNLSMSPLYTQHYCTNQYIARSHWPSRSRIINQKTLIDNLISLKVALNGGTRPRATTPPHPHFLSSMGDGQANTFRWRDTSPRAALSVVLCITYNFDLIIYNYYYKSYNYHKLHNCIIYNI